MKRLFICIFLVCLPLMGCGVQDSGENGALDVKGAFDLKGIITEINIENNLLLVKDTATGLIWVRLPENQKVENFQIDQTVVIWIDGGIKETYPAQADALHVENIND